MSKSNATFLFKYFNGSCRVTLQTPCCVLSVLHSFEYTLAGMALYTTIIANENTTHVLSSCHCLYHLSYKYNEKHCFQAMSNNMWIILCICAIILTFAEQPIFGQPWDPEMFMNAVSCSDFKFYCNHLTF